MSKKVDKNLNSGLSKGIWEHLKTKKKYNTLLLKYNILQEELERKSSKLITEKRIHLKRQEVWEKTLKEQEEKIIELKKKGVKKDVSKSKAKSSRVSRKAKNNK